MSNHMLNPQRRTLRTSCTILKCHTHIDVLEFEIENFPGRNYWQALELVGEV